MRSRLLSYLFACLLAMLPYATVQTATVQAAPIQQQTSTTYRGVVNTTANIRSGPGQQYEIVDQAQAGQTVTVVACNQDCSWLQLDNGNWVAEFLVDLVSSSNATTTSRRTRNSVLDVDNLTLNPPSDAAVEVVTQILSYTGLPQTFDLYSANIYNAAALMLDGKRVILYDPQLIEDIERITDHDWPAVSILAHEIGHHLAGHTLAAAYNRSFELEADYFSGFILQKMGATLSEAQAVMSLLRDHPNMTDHPPQAERLAAIERGWQEAVRQEGLAWEPSFSSFFDSTTSPETSFTAIEQATLLNALRAVADQATLLAVDSAPIHSENQSVIPQNWSQGLRGLNTAQP